MARIAPTGGPRLTCASKVIAPSLMRRHVRTGRFPALERAKEPGVTRRGDVLREKHWCGKGESNPHGPKPSGV